MKFRHLLLSGMIAMVISSCSQGERVANYQVIPVPNEIELTADAKPFVLSSSTKIVYPAADELLATNAAFLAEYVKEMCGQELQVVADGDANGAISLLASLESENPEAYTIDVAEHGIVINGATAQANFYGIQTLRKSIPDAGVKGKIEFPAAKIIDEPRFGYRGTHLDVGRHYFPVDSVKQYIDILALHNINRLHWHLTEDQGWRIEIKSHPELIEKGSQRAGTMIGHDFESNDSVPYGGYYTQDEIRDIVKYAADRYITVIPEIDMPGHMLGALAAYPELGCTGGPYDVWCRWGVSEDILCAGNDDVFVFVEDVLNEVMDLFPSEYIHLGGDEAPKTRWAECPKCQKRIKELGLKTDSHSTAEQKLQTYFMSRATDILTKNGRKMIGWDEILEGGLNPGAVVMSWRGIDGAIEAAQQNHDAILTPYSHCYFDYCQSPNKDEEPINIGGYLPVKKVYSFEPIPAELTPEQGAHVLGAQANLWTEYIKDNWQLQYMLLPRLAALSEVQWSKPEQKDFVNFTKRLPQLIAVYDEEGWHYATHVFDVEGVITTDPENKTITVELTTIDEAPIYYTTDGTEPTENSTLYQGPFNLDETAVVKAASFRKSGKTRTYADSVLVSKSTFKPVTLAEEPTPRYAGNGKTALVDGKLGAVGFQSGEWVGFSDKDMVATIDLESIESVSEVIVRVLAETGSWIFDITGLKVETSTDGTNFTVVAEESIPQLTKSTNAIIPHKVNFAPVEAQFVRVTAICDKAMPAWFENGAGKPSFVFVDEIAIN